MNRITIFDLECTGLDPATDRVIEVAALQYSVTHATVLAGFSSLLHSDDNAAEAINRIPVGALRDEPQASSAWDAVMEMASDSDLIVAHSCDFDRSFSPSALQTVRPWVCSKNDLQWPKQTAPNQSLVSLALAHDLGVATAHRAMADCDLLARLFTRARELGADLEVMLARGLRPKATFAALVSYDDREKAKEAGFQWRGETKTWWRRMAVEDASSLPFKVKEIAA